MVSMHPWGHKIEVVATIPIALGRWRPRPNDGDGAPEGRLGYCYFTHQGHEQPIH
jgi:hypothetical protein